MKRCSPTSCRSFTRARRPTELASKDSVSGNGRPPGQVENRPEGIRRPLGVSTKICDARETAPARVLGYNRPTYEVHPLFEIQGVRRVGAVSGRPDGVVAGLPALFRVRRGLLLDAAAARPGQVAGRAPAGALTGAA